MAPTSSQADQGVALRQAQDGAFRWAVPAGLEVPPDELQLRLDFYHDALVLTSFEEGRTTVRLVSAEQVALAIARDSEFSSGLLPKDALWWRSGRGGAEVAVWRPPQVWRVALQEEAFKPPRRFALPMPGLIFVCSKSQPPAVYAAKRRPTSPDHLLYLAPAYNIFRDGHSCQGTHKYGEDLGKMPEAFFASFFSPAGDIRGRSRKHPDNLLGLWQELDGKQKFPNDDLVQCGRVKELLAGKYISWR